MKTQITKPLVAAVIPFFNEEKTINKIITSVLFYTDYIIAVNDGSTDRSYEHIPKNEKVFVLNFDQNRGKGSALKAGLQKSIELGFDYSVTLDADLQHDPSFIPAFIKALDNYDIVIGNRLNDLTDMPVQRILSNHITSYLLSLKTGVRIKDSQSGFRIFRNTAVKEILPTSNGFEAESEMIINAARKMFSIGFVDIPTIYGDEKSKIRPFQTIINFLKVLLLR